MVAVFNTGPPYRVVIVVKNWGTSTRMVPVWPGLIGVAIVEVIGMEPP
jgi:hypothetical protein